MDPGKLKVVELRAELAQRGLDTKGNKPVLVDRLRKALEEESQSPSAEKIPVDSEDATDAPEKDVNEKVESARSLPPRTPGRSSRSSLSLSTPTKMSTRHAPKTPSSPSMKQMSPLKPQNIEKRLEALPTISESPSEKALITEEDQGLPPSEKEDENEKGLSEPLENEARSPVSGQISEAVQKEEHTEERKNSESEETGVTELSTAETTQEKVQEDTEVTSDELDNKSETSISTSLDEKQETMNLPQSDGEKSSESSKPADVPEDDSQNTECDNEDTKVTEDNKKVNEVQQVEDANVMEEKQNAVNEAEKLEDIPEEEKETEEHEEAPKQEEVHEPDDEKQEELLRKQEEEEILRQEEALLQDEEMEEDDSETVDQAAAEKAIESDSPQPDISEKESLKESDQQSSEKSEQDVEMPEIKEEIKTEIKESDTQQRTERKRKRSASPSEEQPKSPTTIRTEEEPEINDTTVMLSWYDSDLNLLIDKDGFLSATPMHNDGFCYAWAGARASYGVTTGKVFYEAKITEECPINIQNEEHPHLLRVGWSILHTSLQLGDEKLSYGFDGTGKKVTENVFTDYGSPFSKDDIIGCYLDMTDENNVIMSYTVNGKNLGTAFTVAKEELGDKPLFPHVLSKNCRFVCNFGQENPWSEETLEGYEPIGTTAKENLVSGPQRPEKKEDCEIILMCGLPAAGKTFWALKHAAEHPEKMYNILGTHSLLEKMKIMGSSRKQQYTGRWDELVNKCTQAVNKLQEIAACRRRNYILDQTNVYLTVQRRKMKNFSGYQRKAVVVVPTDEEFKSRTAKREAAEGKDLPDVAIMDMKAQFSVPAVGEYFDAVEWVELNEEEGKKVVETYNKEGRDAGFGPQQATKRPRFERADTNKDNRDTREQRPSRDNRESRDNRDHRDRRSSYTDRNRNTPWRGGNNAGWRDRQRGGHLRHVGGGGGGGGGGYGSGWRGSRSGPVAPPPHRNDRRAGGTNDRRTGNDRNRTTGSRQSGSWGPMSNYQGSQTSSWGGQGSNWSSGQSGWSQGGWGQQSQQWGNWKGYGQGTYNQSNYNQGYGNGNWNNSWNQQYYNQYWGQQQQGGQTTTTTTAAGGQAVSTAESTVAPSNNSRATYGYPQGWQEYNAQSYTYSSDDVSGHQSQQQK